MGNIHTQTFPPTGCTAWEDCNHDGVCHDRQQCQATGPNEPSEDGDEDACVVCSEHLEDGDLVYWSTNDDGHMHAECATSYVDDYGKETNEPPKPMTFRASPSPQPNVKADPALIGIAEEMKESGGHWQPCTGCYDTEDGHPTQKYDYSPALQTAIGCGCHECGGLGAVWWHMTDEEVADFANICEEVDTEHELKMRIVRLEAGLRRFRRAYVNLMENGRDRIISLGGSCDPVDVMEAADPELRLIDAALATEGKA